MSCRKAWVLFDNASAFNKNSNGLRVVSWETDDEFFIEVTHFSAKQSRKQDLLACFCWVSPLMSSTFFWRKLRNQRISHDVSSLSNLERCTKSEATHLGFRYSLRSRRLETSILNCQLGWLWRNTIPSNLRDLQNNATISLTNLKGCRGMWWMEPNKAPQWKIMQFAILCI